MMRVSELRGYKSYKAFTAFHTLLLGLKMLPMYLSEPYEEFFSRVQNMPPDDQEKMIRQAAIFVPLERDELEALICFCADPNGVPYTAENLKSLSPEQLVDVIVAVSKEIAKIRISLVTETEKKN